jgi:tyrosyl-tRNA synthetase
LNIFTLLPLERIEEIMREHVKAPEKRLAQRILAQEVITLVHRAEVTEKCIFQTAALYPAPSADSEGGNLLRSERILHAFADDEVMLKRYPFTEIHGMPISRLLKTVGLTKSNGMFLIHIFSVPLLMVSR